MSWPRAYGTSPLIKLPRRYWMDLNKTLVSFGQLTRATASAQDPA